MKAILVAQQLKQRRGQDDKKQWQENIESETVKTGAETKTERKRLLGWADRVVERGA